MKKLPKTNKSVSFMGVKVVLVSLFLTAFMASCDKDNVSEVKTDGPSKEVSHDETNRYYGTIIVRAWGSHNVDCSQPNGFCHNIVWVNFSFFRPLPEGTPVKVENIDGAFVMKIYKSALTEEHKRTLLRNGLSYRIPEGQTIPEQFIESLGFHSNTLREGNYRIVEDRESYTIAVAVN
ncbi:hypothetical protein [Flavobacterium sp.]|uniref:hypothetical protein n=1 Tax=Flavobacterium sp. TaxID=239 RepID=UPI003D6A3299